MGKPLEMRYRELYAMIPSMKCVDGCCECCGPIYLNKTELKMLDGPVRAIIPKEFDPNPDGCPLLLDGRCTVYENRPFICRIYGVAPEREKFLKCPKRNSSEKRLTPMEFDHLWSLYTRLCLEDNDNADTEQGFRGGYWLDGTPRTITNILQRVMARMEFESEVDD